MSKLLIYFPERKLYPKGGAAGYLYNLRQQLGQLSLKDIEIYFLKDEGLKTSIEENTDLRKLIPTRVKDIRRVIKFSHYLDRRLPVNEKAHEYDLLHFHSTEDMYLNRDLLDQYKGKVILTSHSPCVFYKEIIERINPKDYRWFKKKIDRLEEMDIYAFNRADYVIFPCEEAEEPYYNTWSKYSEIRKGEKNFYVPTGIVACHATVSRREIRKKYNIPENAFVVSYVGRHNEIKGYADLKNIGEELLAENEDIYFLIAGKEEPIKGIKNSHWIEVGWTSDPHSLIKASDIFILPNHETYFDLILLEVLSLGIPVVLSETGGNKYFQQFKQDGIRFYQTLEEASNAILDLKKMEHKQRDNAGRNLANMFENEFTVEIFANRYLEVIEKISKL